MAMPRQIPSLGLPTPVAASGQRREPQLPRVVAPIPMRRPVTFPAQANRRAADG